METHVHTAQAESLPNFEARVRKGTLGYLPSCACVHCMCVCVCEPNWCVAWLSSLGERAVTQSNKARSVGLHRPLDYNGNPWGKYRGKGKEV